jgi:hypothetical protein
MSCLFVCLLLTFYDTKLSDSGAGALERIRQRLSDVVGKQLKVLNVRLCAFGGAPESHTELPLKSQILPTARCFAVIWDPESGELLSNICDHPDERKKHSTETQNTNEKQTQKTNQQMSLVCLGWRTAS